MEGHRTCCASNADRLIGNVKNTNSRYCFAKPGAIYLVYLPEGGTCDLDLTRVSGMFRIQWFNPRKGGALTDGSVTHVQASGMVSLGNPPQDADEDWLIVVKRSDR